MKEPLVKLWTVLLIAMVASAAYGQTDQGLIGGKVKDSSGAIIPGATVTIKNERTGEERNSLTNDAGDYVFPALRPSEYTIKATLPGFAPAESKPMQVVVGQRLSVDFTLQPATVSTTVNVEAAVESAVDTSSARMGVNVDLREVQELPVNGRQLSQLYLQAPGAQNTGAGTFGDIRFSGRAVEQNAIRFDGIEASAIIDASPGNVGGELVSPFRLAEQSRKRSGVPG